MHRFRFLPNLFALGLITTLSVILPNTSDATAQPPSEAPPSEAQTDGAQLDGAQLDGAQLDGAQLDGAQLDGAQSSEDLSSAASGGDPDAATQEAANEVTTGEESTQASGPQEIKISVGPSAKQRYVAGSWASFVVNGSNPSSEDTEELIIAMLGDKTNTQYARQFWIPANSKRLGWLIGEVPDDILLDQNSIPLRSIYVKQTERGEEFQNNFLGMPTSVRQLLMSWETTRTGVMLQPSTEDADTELLVESLGDFIYLGRDAVDVGSQDLGLANLDQTLLPTTTRPFDPFDQIVIAEDNVLSDTVAVDRLRSWLAGGGRVWVMVDRVKPESVRRLMGDAASYSIVDRVELSEFEHVRKAVFQGAESAVEPWSSEYPAELVRVLADVDDIQCEIDGWPTAFWVPVGQGEVLFTTLSPNGWANADQPTLTYQEVARRFFIRRLLAESQATQLGPYLDEQIGYSIPSRSVVAGVLGLHMLLVLVAGIVLANRRSLHLLALIVPVAALLATGILVAMGNRSTASVPSTIAIGQVGRPIPNGSEVRIDSMAAVYSQEARDLDIRAGDTTVAQLVEGTEGEVRRKVWDDSGQSRWMFVEQPPGVVRHFTSQSTMRMATPWSTQGQFTEQGFEGRLAGLDLNQCQDAVIVSAASPSMAVQLDSTSGEIQTTMRDVLAPGQFIDAALMSDVQQDRQSLLREMLGPESTIIDAHPSLLVWSNSVDGGFELADDFERRGTLLASIPVSLMRQSAGTRFLVPPGFVRIESALGASGFSGVYNERTGQWMGRDKAADAQVRCVVPKSVLPCKLDRLRIDLKMDAPMRTVQIKGLVNGEFVELFSESNPSGLVDFAVTDPETLQLDSGGGLVLLISLSDTEQERRAASGQLSEDESAISEDQWQIEYMQISFEGVTQSIADPASDE